MDIEKFKSEIINWEIYYLIPSKIVQSIRWKFNWFEDWDWINRPKWYSWIYNWYNIIDSWNDVLYSDFVNENKNH